MTDINAINDPGAREHADGTFTIQSAKRSEQLSAIADEVCKLLDYVDGAPARARHLEAQQVHKIARMMDQVGIISDELAKAGK